jgi:DNA-binding MltR family transcriptional regulator
MVKILIENVEQYLEEIFDEDSNDLMDFLENIENSYLLYNVQEQKKNEFQDVMTWTLIVECMPAKTAASLLNKQDESLRIFLFDSFHNQSLPFDRQMTPVINPFLVFLTSKAIY